MIDQAIRYIPIVDIIESGKFSRILDVGSGSHGCGDYIPLNFVGCDIKFRGVTSQKLVPVIGSSEHLPFKSSAFEIVVSCDTLEHIENQERERVIQELVRVASEKIIIACPCNTDAANCDRKIASWYKFVHRKYPDWLLEHLKNEMPSEKQISQILAKSHLDFHIIDNENNTIHLIIVALLSIPIISMISAKLVKWCSTKLSFITKCLNFGTPYRKIFVISKK